MGVACVPGSAFGAPTALRIARVTTFTSDLRSGVAAGSGFFRSSATVVLVNAAEPLPNLAFLI